MAERLAGTGTHGAALLGEPREHKHDGARVRGALRRRRPALGDTEAREAALAPVRAGFAVSADSLFTYCLSVLCDHQVAAAAARNTRELALLHQERLRDRELLRGWLYALARYECLRRLEETGGEPPLAPTAEAAEAGEQQEFAEFASLAWPEAAGLAPQQREALELAVRHGLEPEEVAAVLDLEPAETRSLLARAAGEVERTRVALAVVESGGCVGLTRIADTRTGLVGEALRGELVRHVEGCARCVALGVALGAGSVGGHAAGAEVGAAAGSVEVGAAGVGAAGAGRFGGELSVLPAPEAVRGPGTPLPARARLAINRRAEEECAEVALPEPLFDRRGFPVLRLSRRAGGGPVPLWRRTLVLSTTCLLVVAPLLVVWAMNRGLPLHDSPPEISISSVEVGPEGGPSGVGGSGGSAVSGDGAARGRDGSGEGSGEGRRGGADGELKGKGKGSAGDSAEPSSSAPGNSGPGGGAVRLGVSARQEGGRTVVTLRASGGRKGGGGAPISWRAASQAGWLRANPASGRLAPGESRQVVVTVDQSRTPEGSWAGRITFPPSTAVVTVRGYHRPKPTEPSPTPSPVEPSPSAPATSDEPSTA